MFRILIFISRACAEKPLAAVTSLILGASALEKLEYGISESLAWFCPCLFVIFADLFSGIHAAKERRETVRFSGAARRTLNKMFCYLCWTMFCVSLNERYDTEICATVGMALIFAIEGTSAINNWLEPHGYHFSIRGLLSLIGRKKNLEGLENIIEKEDKDEDE